MRYLALGDSYTIGESVAESERWPVQLAQRLRAQGISLPDPEIIARTGWTTDELEAGIEAANPQGAFDLVSLLIGVNNQYRGRSQTEYRAQFRALLQRAIQFAGGNPQHVVILSIPDWGVTPFAANRDRGQIAADINAFNAINREETELAAAFYVDVTPISREAVNELELIAADGLHPSGMMYARWVNEVLPVARQILADA
jgi:lysophospholipase L1-like esterase